MVNHSSRQEEKSTITPGKWRVFSWPTNNPDEGKVWCYGFEAKEDGRTFAEHVANAKLMATAPEFLALCREVEAHCRVETPETKGNPTAHAAEGKALRARMRALLRRFEN